MGDKDPGCVFCKRLRAKNDRGNLILYRARKSFVIMNKYPYNGGHLLVVPQAHKSSLQSLTPTESCEMFELARKSVKILQECMPADGFNIGMNIGRIAGAGIEDHLHIHIIPRFAGDTSFLAIVAETKVQSISMMEIYDMLKKKFDRLKAWN